MSNVSTALNPTIAPSATRVANPQSITALAKVKPKRTNVKNTPTVIRVQQQASEISKNPAKQIFNQLTKLQVDADKHLAVVLDGRKIKETLVAKIYTEYFEAQQLDEMPALVEEIEKALKEKKIAFRSNSRVSTKFVRYVFANYGEDDLSDKDAFKYGRGIDVGYKKSIDPEQFASFVQENGGYSNIKEQIDASATPTTHEGSAQGASKLESLSKQHTVCEFEVNDWADDDENYRVYIAVRNDEDLALLKAVSLSKDGIEKLMLQIEREQKAKDKPDADAKRQADEAYKRMLQTKLANNETELGNKQGDLQAAFSNKTPMQIAELRAAVRCLESDIKATKVELQKFKVLGTAE